MAMDAAICNMALGHLGVGTAPVEDPETDNSAEARNCRTYYHQARKMTLEAYDWGFARTFEQLSLHNVDPTDAWDFRYAYPAHCLKLLGVPDPRGETYPRLPHKKQRIGGEITILSNVEEPQMEFIYDVEDTGLFSGWFIHCFSILLAWHMARPTTGKRDIKNDLWQQWLGAISDASAHDANDDKESPEPDANYIRDRQ